MVRYTKASLPERSSDLPNVGPKGVSEYIDVKDELWMKDAACYGMDTDLFFPDRSKGLRDVAERELKAKRVCARCLVVEECLAYAMAVSEIQCPGIWGGTNAKERRRLRRAATRPTLSD